jgi:hypothetical protein
MTQNSFWSNTQLTSFSKDRVGTAPHGSRCAECKQSHQALRGMDGTNSLLLLTAARWRGEAASDAARQNAGSITGTLRCSGCCPDGYTRR